MMRADNTPLQAEKGKWRSHQESNLDLKFRKLLFYPLNYGSCSIYAASRARKCPLSATFCRTWWHQSGTGFISGREGMLDA